jgi:FixJ family two-component response regulator
MNHRVDADERPLVFIVDDDAEIRNGVNDLLESVGIEAAAFASTRELLEAELPDRPGCMILDVRMPGSSGLDLQDRLAAKGDAKPIVFLTAHGDVPMTVKAMKAGAVDFLVKPVRDQALLDAVSAGIKRDIAQQASARSTRRQLELFATLTPREREVLLRVARGRLNKQIAFDLGISEVTVKLHRSNVMRKMKACSLGALIRIWEALPTDIRQEGVLRSAA